MLYSYFHDCNVSGNCITYELCFISGDDKYWGLVTRPRVAFSVVSHSILHLHKHAIRLWLYSLSSWWRIGDIITPIRSLNDCTSLRRVYLRFSRKYLSFLSNKHATLHQMSVHCIHIIMISTLLVCNHIIIKAMHTQPMTCTQGYSTQNIIYIYISKEWVSTKMGATRAHLIKNDTK